MKTTNKTKFMMLTILSTVVLFTSSVYADLFHGEITLKGKNGEILEVTRQKLEVKVVSAKKLIRYYSDFEGTYKAACDVDVSIMANGVRELSERCPDYSLMVSRCDGAICDGMVKWDNFLPDLTFSISEFNTLDRRLLIVTYKDGMTFKGVQGVYSLKQEFKRVVENKD